jgi:hypothetical protein
MLKDARAMRHLRATRWEVRVFREALARALRAARAHARTGGETAAWEAGCEWAIAQGVRHHACEAATESGVAL